MPRRANRLRETAREVLPYFVKAWGASDEETRLRDRKNPPQPEGEPKWVQWLERDIRREVDPGHPAKRLYAMIIQTLLEVVAPARATDFRRSENHSPALNGVSDGESERNKTPGPDQASEALFSKPRGVLFRPPRWARSPTDEDSVETVSRSTMRNIVRARLKKYVSGGT